MTAAEDRPPLASPLKIALAGIPWDENSSFLRGPSEAPPLIRAALFSKASGLRSESGVEFPPGQLIDAGDVPVRPGEEMLGEIERFIAALLERDLRPLSLGGDHAVTYPIIKAFSRKYRDLTILQFDAHSDLYDIFEGNRYSHACPFARIMEEGLAKRLVQVGVRTLNRHQREQAERFGVEIIEMKDWRAAFDLAFDGPSISASTWTRSIPPLRPASRIMSREVSRRDRWLMSCSLWKPMSSARISSSSTRAATWATSPKI